MKPFILLLLTLFILNSCDPPRGQQCPPCPLAPVVNPFIWFTYADKLTNEDLFTGDHPKYTVNQLNAFHLINGKQEMQYLEKGTRFQLFVNPIHRTDTILLKIADLPIDTLLFRTAQTGTCCPKITFTGASFNGKEYSASTNPNTTFVFSK